ncbi:Transcriptional regulator KdgR [Pontiella desulfatans]|uniref:Transcriptional regulator KdgR n=1 Tax=Pontiella desulfatans TaxID=2750659 RepID=A0A6C2U423_PONDE|nr:IclR family transcriptional regulator C-terminal domain-containing protein [Pontiella desulfatans]VGO14577.1 Transcriptional regulator KdgR [Pontiella desulfatans]
MPLEKLTAKARDVMRRLEQSLGYTIGLGTLQPGKGDGIVLAAVDGSSGFSFHLAVHYEFPLHTGAPSKAMLAYLPEAERRAYYAHMDFRRYTQSTITSPADFEAELESVREKGYSIDVSEQIEGCHCVGVPVFDEEHRVVAGLWATGPSAGFPVRIFDQVAEALRKSALEMSSRCAFSSRSSNRDYIHSVVGQAREIMENNLHRPLDVEELAANLYVGYSWFRKVFREQRGMAPAAYHQQLRLERAKVLLAESDLSIRQISETLGFKTQNHFSALFKRKTGLAPSGFRGQ